MIRQHKKMILTHIIATLLPILIGLLSVEAASGFRRNPSDTGNEPDEQLSKAFAVFGFR